MLSARVPFRSPFDQPIFAHILEALGTGLSLWLGLRFFCDFVPDEPLLVRIAAAVTCEGGRLWITRAAFQELLAPCRLRKHQAQNRCHRCNPGRMSRPTRTFPLMGTMENVFHFIDP